MAPTWQDFIVTAYHHGCIMPVGKEGGPRKAANGRWPEVNWTIAAPKEFPFGTVLELSVDGIVTTRIVGDRGRAIKGKRLDLFVESCDHARRWGRRRVSVRVLTQPLGRFNESIGSGSSQ